MFRLAQRLAAPVTRNIEAAEFISSNWGGIHRAFEIPNFRRAPFWQYIYVQNFVTRMFDTAPIERQERYYFNSCKFRLQTAYASPGTRPAAKISQEQAKLRYFYRGLDNVWTPNELKDYYFKLREQALIQQFAGVQYPFVHRQMMPEETDSLLKVDLYPTPQAAAHFHEEH